VPFSSVCRSRSYSVEAFDASQMDPSGVIRLREMWRRPRIARSAAKRSTSPHVAIFPPTLGIVAGTHTGTLQVIELFEHLPNLQGTTIHFCAPSDSQRGRGRDRAEPVAWRPTQLSQLGDIS